jgi:hypothetical protein
MSRKIIGEKWTEQRNHITGFGSRYKSFSSLLCVPMHQDQNQARRSDKTVLKTHEWHIIGCFFSVLGIWCLLSIRIQLRWYDEINCMYFFVWLFHGDRIDDAIINFSYLMNFDVFSTGYVSEFRFDFVYSGVNFHFISLWQGSKKVWKS